MWTDAVHWLRAFAGSWYETKMFIERSVGFSSDSIHVLVGAICPLVVALILRTSVRAWTPWLVTFALIIVNEAVDLTWEHWPHPAMQYGESAKDFLLTMVLPTILLLTARFAPGIYVKSADQQSG
jgi:hypothetical protein